MLDECAQFWWELYKDMPYVHRSDGITIINVPPVGPEYFIKTFNDDSVILAEDEGRLAGMLVCSIEEEKRTGNIMSCYVPRDLRGREIADRLLAEALEHFRKMELCRAVAAPGGGKTMEVECPIHLAVLDAGFGWGTWENDWQPVCVDKDQYGVFLGGSLEGFRLQPEILEKKEKLHREGIEIKRVTQEEFHNLRRYDTGDIMDKSILEYDGATFVALVDGLAVGWLSALSVEDDDPPGVTTGEAIPEVVPMYQRRGIGKTLYHLGIDDIVQRGVVCGWTHTGIYSPARLIYRSIGYRYWCATFDSMSKRLR